MTDPSAGLLADILAHPDDDDLRLIYADWLEDHDEPERAEFIRVQCESAGLACDCPPKVRHVVCKRCWLFGRESELLDIAAVKDWSSMPAAVKACRWHRGFIDIVHLPCADWLAHGPALVRCHPLREVRLSDKQPAQPLRLAGEAPHWQRPAQPLRLAGGAPHWRWYCGPGVGRHDLPECLFTRLPGTVWPTEADALAALSAACLAWARGQPHLVSTTTTSHAPVT